MEQSQPRFTWRLPWSTFKNISCFSLKVGTIPLPIIWKTSVYLWLGRKQHARHKSQVSDALLNRKCTWVKYIWGGRGWKRRALYIKMSFTWTFLATQTAVAVRFRIFYGCIVKHVGLNQCNDATKKNKKGQMFFVFFLIAAFFALVEEKNFSQSL